MIPDLGTTLERYLEGLKAVIPSAQYEQTKKTVHEFARTSGPVLQQQLIAFAEERDNWVSRFVFLVASLAPDLYKDHKELQPIAPSPSPMSVIMLASHVRTAVLFLPGSFFDLIVASLVPACGSIEGGEKGLKLVPPSLAIAID